MAQGQRARFIPWRSMGSIPSSATMGAKLVSLESASSLGPHGPTLEAYKHEKVRILPSPRKTRRRAWHTSNLAHLVERLCGTEGCGFDPRNCVFESRLTRVSIIFVRSKSVWSESWIRCSEAYPNPNHRRQAAGFPVIGTGVLSVVSYCHRDPMRRQRSAMRPLSRKIP